jgi:hypothetical protein
VTNGSPNQPGRDEVSPFEAWQRLRDELAPFLGERAVSLFAFSIFDEVDGFEGATYFRAELAATGNDVDHPQVTETERLLIDWGRLVASDPSSVEDRRAEFERVFNPTLRRLLIEFAALTVATAIVETVS